MKIEIGESLFYTWLRHLKECQLVQTNWKASPHWHLENVDELEQLKTTIDTHYTQTYNYGIFKKNASLSQLLQQTECDALGISIQDDKIRYHAVEVAFHEAGLNYGTRAETVGKVLAKFVRIAFCLYGHFLTKDAEIVFASPKINPAILKDLVPCIEDLNTLFAKSGYNFSFTLIANEMFYEEVLKKIEVVSEGISDTTELFLRSYQLCKMFSEMKPLRKQTLSQSEEVPSVQIEMDEICETNYSQFKVGQIARIFLRQMLESGCASEEEISAMQTKEYSKKVFDLQFPLLLKVDQEDNPPNRYYATPLMINGVKYYLCSEWFEKVNANNDRPYLIKWIEAHRKTSMCSK